MNKPKCYAITKKKDYAEILIYGVIGIDPWTGEGNSSEGFYEEFTKLEDIYDKIVVRINSPGGYIDEGLPIFNLINQSKKNIETRNDGVAASMAGFILLAGKKVSAPSTSILMIHKALTGIIGNANDFREAADELEAWEGSLIPAFSKKTGLNEDEVRSKWFDGKNHFLTGQEAFDAGLVDELIDSDADIPKDAKTNASYKDILNAYRKVRPETSLYSTIRRHAASLFESKPNNQQTLDIDMIKEPICAVLGKPFDTSDEAIVTDVKNAIEAKTTAENNAASEKALREAAEQESATLREQNTAKDTEIATLKAELEKRPAAAPSAPAGGDAHDDDESAATDPINGIAKGYVNQ